MVVRSTGTAVRSKPSVLIVVLGWSFAFWRMIVNEGVRRRASEDVRSAGRKLEGVNRLGEGFEFRGGTELAAALLTRIGCSGCVADGLSSRLAGVSRFGLELKSRDDDAASC